MDLRLTGKRALVTGSSSGISAAIAKSAAAQGIAVAIHGRDQARHLTLGQHLDATSAGLRVGYYNASHFNREYKRLFGVPPIRGVGRLRQSAPCHSNQTPAITKRRAFWFVRGAASHHAEKLGVRHNRQRREFLLQLAVSRSDNANLAVEII